MLCTRHASRHARRPHAFEQRLINLAPCRRRRRRRSGRSAGNLAVAARAMDGCGAPHPRRQCRRRHGQAASRPDGARLPRDGAAHLAGGRASSPSAHHLSRRQASARRTVLTGCLRACHLRLPLSFRGGQRPSPESIPANSAGRSGHGSLVPERSCYGFRAPLRGPGMTAGMTALCAPHVMAGLVPAIPIRRSAAPQQSGSPAQGR